MQKLYCYVDETGQDTAGRIFVVAVIVTAANKDEFHDLCESIENATGKGKLKWGKAHRERRLEYLRRVFAQPRFHGNLCYAIFEHTTDYEVATIEAIASAVNARKPSEDFTTLVYVDGLSKTKRHEYATALRRLGVPIHKVQGVTKDENNSLTRLADAIAGFVRDALEGEDDGSIRQLFDEAKNSGVLVETHK